MGIPNVDEVLQEVPRYANKARLASDVRQLNQLFPALKPAVHPHGPSNTPTFCLRGTIPITASGVTYHIPICIWLSEHYPNGYPEAVLQPTMTMFIAPNHKAVDKHGTVYHPYISQWRAEGSTLTQLVIELCATFSQAPPLYDRAAAGASSSNSQAYPVSPAPHINPTSQPPPNNVAVVDEGPVSEDMLCVICLDKKKCMMFFPCRHLCACEGCARSVTQCPTCRQPIQQQIKAFI